MKAACLVSTDYCWLESSGSVALCFYFWHMLRLCIPCKITLLSLNVYSSAFGVLTCG